MFPGSLKTENKFLLSLGLPGGDQVDGLPPAASTDSVSASWHPRQLQNYLGIWGSFFEKLSFYTISIHFLYFFRLFIDIAEAHARGFATL